MKRTHPTSYNFLSHMRQKLVRAETGTESSQAAFSLVELLVVVAVIGILAALLLPTLARGKASAHRVVCVNNLRQLGLATQMYWDDNGGNAFRYRGVSTNGGDAQERSWLSSRRMARFWARCGLTMNTPSSKKAASSA